MIPFRLSEAAAAVGGKFHAESEDLILKRLFLDSRESHGETGLFFALRGEKRDAHDFVEAVVATGNAAFVDREGAFVKNTVLVPDVKAAIYALADWYRREKCPDVKTICITGSVGKTTTKDMTGLVFAASSDAYVTKGNKNSLIGVPLSVMSIENDAEYAVLELGMSERGEIERLSMLARPYLSVITTIGSSHLEALGSVENIKNEKFDILKGERPGGRIILNADNVLEYAEGKKLGDRAVFCSAERNDCEFCACDVSENACGIDFVIEHHGKRTPIHLGIAGRHNVMDAMLAFAAGTECGFDAEKCAEALSHFTPDGNRQHSYKKDGITVIADCYNASPESMKAALSVLSSAEGRKIAVLGDMLELGSDSEDLHRKVALEAGKTADVLIFVGDMAEISASSCGRECSAFSADEKADAAGYLGSILKSGDTVLFKASNRLHFEDIIKEAGL